jgi:UDP-N-acetylglucosamine 3-dehydrogenase
MAMFRVAIVGAGGMAGVHAGCYSKMGNAQIVGIYDIRPDAAQTLADRHSAKAFGDFVGMLTETRPDVVDVCCPTPWHREYVCAAAERAAEVGIQGISVEKPMGRTLKDCDAMIAACELAGIPLFVAQVVRFFPEFAQAKAAVDGGAVGKPAAVRTRRGGAMPRAWNDWYANEEWSGGCILDLMVHDFDWLRWTFGEVERVFAKRTGGKTLPESDFALVTLRFQSGVIAHVEGSWSDPSGFRVAFEIAGDAGLLELNFNQPLSPPFRKALRETQTEKVGVALPESPNNTDPYFLELAHFLACLESGTALSITPQEGRAAVEIALAALESAATGKAITLR